MGNLPKIHIKVPGTSANLGPGFDLMGMALKIYNQFDFSFKNHAEFVSTLKNGDPLPFADKDDLVKKAYESYFVKFAPSVIVPIYHCKMELSLPLKGGLGSSASAIVAGLTLARQVHKSLSTQVPLPSEKQFLQFLSEWEGHPDNTLPAYLGGLVFAFSTYGEPIQYFSKKFPKSVALFILTPEYAVSTEESRKTLPSHYTTSDVIFNLSRIGAWMHFLDKRKFGDLLVALQDKMHTPYRVTQGSPLFEVSKILDKDHLGHCLSGSGPSMLVFMERKSVKRQLPKLEVEIREKMDSMGIAYSFRRVQTCDLGTQITLH
ncbi:MAG: homoserine kinase [Rhodobacteraceae bacterium]|nr:homoserine kinase [Paracoccaceae bacterium]